jgi:hypothetical protein
MNPSRRGRTLNCSIAFDTVGLSTDNSFSTISGVKPVDMA